MRAGWASPSSALAGATLLLHAASAQVLPNTAPGAPALPAWVADVVGNYAGSVRNAGRMECHRTELTVQDGQLVGHYWIDDTDPLEGTLTGFVAESDSSGRFTWTDRYGSGVEFLAFSSDHTGFVGAWGTDQADPANPVWAARGTSCQAPAVSFGAPGGGLIRMG